MISRNIFYPIQQKLYTFFEENLTKGRDPFGKIYDVKPDIF